MAERPSLDLWLREAKAEPSAADCGMFLFHNGVVRQSARATVREGAEGMPLVQGMRFSYDAEKVAAAVETARSLPGIYCVRVWLNEGQLELGDDIMLVLIGGDIRPRVIEALQSLVGEIKNHCVVEQELYS
jgi:molybdopterin synthase catalytic subunit